MFEVGTDTTFSHRVLDAISLRTRVAMHNLANKNTAGFKRYDVRFEDELREVIRGDRDLQTVYPRLEHDTSGSPGVNNVSEFDEVAIMEKARALHEIFSKRIGGYFNNINKAIKGHG